MIYISIIYYHIPPRFLVSFNNLHHRFSLPIRRLHVARAGHVFFPKFGRKDGRFGWEAPRQLRIRRFWAPTPSGRASDGRFFLKL